MSSSSSSSKTPTKSNVLLKQWGFHLGAYVILIVIAMLYFKPVAFDGKVMTQHDNIQSVAMQREIFHYKWERGVHGREINWTNQYFGGMPTALMRNNNINHVHAKLVHPVLLNLPYNEWMTLFMIMLGCYIGLSLLGVRWVSAVGLSVVLALFTANTLYIQAGHSGKMVVISTIPAIMGAFVYAYKKNWLLGSSIFAVIMSFNISQNHIQMTYYLALSLAILTVAFTIDAFKNGHVKKWVQFMGGMAIASILSISSNLGFIWPTYDYGEESTRGATELSSQKTESGLDPDYVFSLSFEKAEIFTLMFPNFYGGTQGKSFLQDPQSETYKTFRNPSVQQSVARVAQQQGISDINGFLNQIARQYTPHYRGSQTMSGGPMYYGIVVCFLFILSLLLMRGAFKWGIIGSFAFFVILAWGRNFPFVSDFMYEYFPLYNKFRDTKMTLLVGQGVVVLAIGVGLMNLVHFDPKKYEGTWAAKLLPYLKQDVSAKGYVVLTTAIALGLCALIALWAQLGTLTSPKDAELMTLSPQLVLALQADRAVLAMADVWRALIFVGLSSGVLWMYTRKILPRWEFAMLGLAILAMIDLSMVNSEYLSEDSYITPSNVQQNYVPSPADQVVQQDKTLHYRVADYSRGAPSQTAMTSQFHKSVGGYFAAKPKLYQELWTHYQMDNPSVALQQHSNIFNMLNVKYILVPPNEVNKRGVMDNPTALNNAWFIDRIKTVGTADEFLAAVDDLQPLQEAVIRERSADYIQGLNGTYTPGDRIYLSSYDPDTMTYVSETSTERFAVFSEMYYPPEKGWTVYIDGEEVPPFIRVNYLLRGLRVPAGKHEIKMIFAPNSIVVGRQVGSITSILILLMLLVAIGLYYRNKASIEEERTLIV